MVKLTAREVDVINLTATVCGSTSAIACGIALLYLGPRVARRFYHAVAVHVLPTLLAGSKRREDQDAEMTKVGLSDKLIKRSAVAESLSCGFAIFQFVAAVCFALGSAFVEEPARCRSQAWGIHVGSLGSTMYTIALTTDLLISAALQRPELSARLEFVYHIGTWVVSIVFAAASSPYFGFATLWCWVVTPDEQFSFFYSIVIAGYGVNAALIMASWHILRQKGGELRESSSRESPKLEASGSRTEIVEAHQAMQKLIYRQMLQVLAYNVVWAFGIYDRVSIALGFESFLAVLLHSLFVPAWGALATAVYVLDSLQMLQFARAAREREKKSRVARVAAAIESVLTVRFGVCFISFANLRKAGRLLSHEEARSRGVLDAVLDTHEDCLRFVRANPTVFFSHQWTGFHHPDPSNLQYELMVGAALELCQDHAIEPSELFCWIDFTSVPQANPYTQALSIATLGVYASLCEFFVIVAPELRHAQLGTACNLESYKSRGWCRLEQWAHLTAAGTARMFIVTGLSSSTRRGLLPSLFAPGASPAPQGDGLSALPSHLLQTAQLPRAATRTATRAATHKLLVAVEPLEAKDPPGIDEAMLLASSFDLHAAAGSSQAKRHHLTHTAAAQWLAESIQVFAGNFTVPDDKPKLVDVVLGLWALTLVAKESGHAHALPLVRTVQTYASSVFPQEHFGDLVSILEAQIHAQYQWKDSKAQGGRRPSIVRRQSEELESSESQGFKARPKTYDQNGKTVADDANGEDQSDKVMRLLNEVVVLASAQGPRRQPRAASHRQTPLEGLRALWSGKPGWLT